MSTARVLQKEHIPTILFKGIRHEILITLDLLLECNIECRETGLISSVEFLCGSGGSVGGRSQ